ncbi:amino-acid N-acetyltransferase [Cavenderia fasciculata]|uniref:Arginine biosynthesis bifunctional protein ArgJ, mitochondrial n=1 Tax=Cavenderia fasciculata TaxID=261658 RepID=F4Q5N8_CACFS|nr:amino-acid N-acetyltransferase [Cavenderia fasciculata]EGG17297.1 amino-acid N-acetyltransferase [Cavenderia fasciculata]|eukprot:XP_004355781.1 amino-acid N-acetyltransferase [Cavenderia fasciculata]
MFKYLISNPTTKTINYSFRYISSTVSKGPKGFKTGTTACGLKKNGNSDICVIYSESACNVAAVFTENKVKAAPVLLSKSLLDTYRNTGFQSLIINSGGANACTGDQGMTNAKTMSNLTSSTLKVKQPSFVMSTGIIGQQLDMNKVEKGIKEAITKLNPNDWLSAAKAIMTTDKVPKLSQKIIKLSDGKEANIVGICKGAGMIHPNMATMLCTVCTDAAVGEDVLNQILKHSVHYSFNSINVDGDMSTNDTVVLVSNGQADNKLINSNSSEDFNKLQEAIRSVMTELCQMIVRDAEGASKFVSINVVGADTEVNAKTIADTISRSSLVKTALYGADANWGRVLAAVGYSGVNIDPLKVSMWFSIGDGKDIGIGKKNDQKVCMQFLENGQPLEKDEKRAAAILEHGDVSIIVDLGMGKQHATMWTCDLTEEYVRANSHYRT